VLICRISCLRSGAGRRRLLDLSTTFLILRIIKLGTHNQGTRGGNSREFETKKDTGKTKHAFPTSAKLWMAFWDLVFGIWVGGLE
jgi:hypothetical protein